MLDINTQFWAYLLGTFSVSICHIPIIQPDWLTAFVSVCTWCDLFLGCCCFLSFLPYFFFSIDNLGVLFHFLCVYGGGGGGGGMIGSANYELLFSVLSEISRLSCRRGVWESHVAYIESHNAAYQRGDISFYLGENQFADMVSDQDSTEVGCCGLCLLKQSMIVYISCDLWLSVRLSESGYFRFNNV